MSSIDSLTQKLASTTVEEENEEKEVSFVGKALTLDTEEDAAEIVKAIENCPGMITLQLEGNTVGIPAAKAIGKALENQSSFKRALWKDMFTRRDKTEIPQALSYLSKGIMTANAKLVVLNLSDNAFGPRGLVGLQELLESPSCYTLEELHFNNNGLGIQGAKLLSDSICKCIENSQKAGTPMKLKVFVCGRNRLENDGAISVSKFLKELGTLEAIAMPQNGIYSPGINALSEAFSSNHGLKVINLEDNSLTEEGAVHIAECLPSLQRLQMLNLGDCIVRTGGAIAIADKLADACPDLRHLNLGFNEINLDGGKHVVDAIKHKEFLQTLILNGNNFGEEGCQIIKDEMEDIGKLEYLGSLSEDEGSNDEEDDDDDDYEDIDDDEEDEEEEDDADSQDESSRSMGGKAHQSPMTKDSHKSPMSKVTIEDFLSNPTAETLVTLHKMKQDFMSALPEDCTIADCLDLFLKISSVVTLEDDAAKVAAYKYADELLSKAYSLDSEDAADFNNRFLVAIGLLKGEDQKPKMGLDISGSLLVIEHAVKQPYFQTSTRNLLQLFLSQPFQYVTAGVKAKHLLNQALYQF